MTLLSQHRPVFNYSLISSHHSESGFEDRREVLCLLLLLFSVFLRRSWVGLREFVSRDESSSGTGWGLPYPICLCLFSSTQEHILTHLTLHKHILSPLHTLLSLKADCRVSIFPSSSLLRDPLWTKESRPVSTWDVVPHQAIPHHGFIQHKWRTSNASPPPSSVPFSPSVSLSLSTASFSHKHKHQHPQTSPPDL